jgi:hypothetical protein
MRKRIVGSNPTRFGRGAFPMTKSPHNVNMFDSAYRDRIRDTVYKTIVEVSIDQETKVAALRNHEI